jgi:hypothetical protein
MNSINAAKEQPIFKVTAISDEIANEIRATGKWAGFPASSSVAMGYGPCRLCLNTFETGKDERTFFTYNAFHGRAELPLPGPVFIHKEGCERFGGDIFPPALRTLPMLFEAFSADGEMVQRIRVIEDRIESQIEQLFAMETTKYIYVRNAEAGCFMAFIDRR